MTATAAGTVLENAGEGAGLDTSSIGEIATEHEMWDWIKRGLIPAVKGLDWMREGSFRYDFNKRYNCDELIEQGKECEVLRHPNFSTSSGIYDVPYDSHHMRKYNLLIGGIKIEQLRAPYEVCPAKPFTRAFPGYDVVGQAPAYKCYKEKTYNDKKNAMPADLHFDHLYPRSYQTHIDEFQLEHPNGNSTTLNGAAASFEAFFSLDRVGSKAQTMLYKCLLNSGAALGTQSLACGCQGANITKLNTLFRDGMVSGFHSRAATLGNLSDVAVQIAQDSFGLFGTRRLEFGAEQYGAGDLNDNTSHFNISSLAGVSKPGVKRECESSANGALVSAFCRTCARKSPPFELHPLSTTPSRVL